MSLHDFTALFDAYPTAIAAMGNQFSSHRFIQQLAHQEQVLYIEALYAYRHHLRNGKPAPFMMVHGILAGHLERMPELVRKVGTDSDSHDLFGGENAAVLWEKV